MTKQKFGIIILIVIGIIGGVFLFPRIILYIELKMQNLDMECEGQYFTEYDVTDNSLVPVEGLYFTIGVPSDFVNEFSELGTKYQSQDETQVVFWKKTISTNDVIILDSIMDEDDKRLRKGFEKLGYGIPDTGYMTSKCICLVKESDYSFMNYDQALSYAFAAYVKSETSIADINYVYEREDMYAIVTERYIESDGVYKYYVEMYHPDNLNSYYLVILDVKEKETAYAIINSIKLK